MSPSHQELSSEAELYRRMLRIRLFEERLLREFTRGTLTGTTHTCMGQEADAVGVLDLTRPGDVVVSNHRGHGHFLAFGGDMVGLAAEIMGRASGVCRGRGGSQHLHQGGFYSNGVLGSTLPVAAGMALAEKMRASGAVVVLFLGDGAFGEGAVYEGMNLLSLWRLPLLLVVEDNAIAQSTPRSTNMAGDVLPRIRAFEIPATESDTTDVRAIRDAAAPLFDQCRSGAGPVALVIRTVRLAAHSKGDDTRPREELDRLRARDPIASFATSLADGVLERVRAGCEAEVEDAFRRASEAPLPTLAGGRA